MILIDSQSISESKSEVLSEEPKEEETLVRTREKIQIEQNRRIRRKYAPD
jgi:hypothetical protein